MGKSRVASRFARSLTVDTDVDTKIYSSLLLKDNLLYTSYYILVIIYLLYTFLYILIFCLLYDLNDLNGLQGVTSAASSPKCSTAP